MIDLPAIRKRQAAGEPDGRAIGVGFAFYTEQSGHGTVEWVKRKSRVVPGYESANARMLPDGSLIIHVGTQNHGQGHETTLAQIAAHELTIDPGADFHPLRRHRDDAVRLRHLRLALDRVCRRRGGPLLPDADREDPAHRRASAADRRRQHASRPARCTARPARSASPRSPTPPTCARSICRPAWSRCSMPPATYEPTETGGVFAYGTHAVVVAVEPDTGVVEILDYVVSEDCGTMINPMIVDGQVQGGIAPGHRHRALRGNSLRRDRPAARHHVRRLHGALRAGDSDGADRASGPRRRRPPNMASRAWAKAARSRHRRRSPTRLPTRSAASAQASTKRR